MTDHGVDAREYHDRTKHTPESIRDGHRLDFENKPTPYKVYEHLSTRPLADGIRPPQQPALTSIAEPTPDGAPDAERGPDLATLTNCCYYSAGVAKEIELRDHTRLFRAAATTGALYHVDLYVVCGDLAGGSNVADEVPDLDAGVYHFDPRTLSLDVLREGDYRGVLAEASETPRASERGATSEATREASASEGIAEAPLSIVATSTWWRNAWKYRDRTFRHAFWDSGTVLANLLAVARALDLRAEVVTGFADEAVVDLLGVDPEREAPLELVAVGSGDSTPHAPIVERIDPSTEPLSPDEKEFPLIHEAWEAGVLESGDEAEEWRAGRPAGSIGTRSAGDGERIALDPVDHETASARPLHETIRRRGSCREYEREPISFRKLSTVLDRAVRGVPMDVRREDDPPLAFCDCYLVVNAVGGLASGTYRFHPAEGELERLRSGEFRREAGRLALDQRLAADAAACVYFLTDLEGVTDALGDRGYRVAQLEAALTAGRLYLGTYAHRTLGGTGLTFYDDVVSDFFDPHADGQTPLFLYTMGKPA